MATFDGGQLSQWAVLLGVMDCQGYLKEINSTWEQLGWMPEQLVNANYWDYVHPNDLPLSKELWQQLAQGHENQISFENRYQDIYAEYHWILWTAAKTPEQELVYLSGVEVTRHKQQEALLREKNQLHQTILNQSEFGTLVYTANGKITFCNPKAAELLGMDSHEVVGKMDWGLVLVYEDGSDFPANEHPALITLRLGRTCQPLTMGIYRQDDSFVWVSISSHPVWFKSGEDNPQPDIAVVSLRDKTDAKYQVDELRNKSGIFSAIFEEVPLGIGVVDEEGRVIQINPFFSELVGYRADDLLGKPFTLLLPPALRAEATKQHSAFLAGEILEEQAWVLQHADGRKLDSIHISSICMEQQDPPFKILFLTPLQATSRNAQLETQDATSELNHYIAWLRFLFDSLPITFLCLNRQGQLLFGQGKHMELLRIHNTRTEQPFLDNHQHLLPFIRYIQRALTGEAFSKIITYAGYTFKIHYKPLVEQNEWVGTQILFYEITEEFRLKNRLKNALYELESLTPYTPMGLMYVEGNRIVRPNQQCTNILGYAENELLKLPLEKLFSSKDAFNHYQQLLTEQAGKQTTWQDQYWFRRMDGGLIHCRVNIKLINKAGRMLWLIETIDKEETVNKGDNLQKALWRISQDAFLIVDANLYIQEANPASAIFTGYSTSELVGGALPELDTGRQDKVFYESLLEQVVQESFWQGDIWQRHKNGSVYQCVMTVQSYETKPAPQNRRYLVALSQQKHSSNSIQDPLTGLASRNLFQHKLVKIHAAAQRNSKYYAVLLVAIDNMQTINTQYGYAIGDEFLCKIGHILNTSVRDSDILGRFSGDIFSIGLAEITQVQDAGLVGKMMLFKLTQPVVLSQAEIPCSVSIGVAVYPEDGNEMLSIIQAAETAVNHAKQHGGSQIAFFNPTLGKH